MRWEDAEMLSDHSKDFLTKTMIFPRQLKYGQTMLDGSEKMKVEWEIFRCQRVIEIHNVNIRADSWSLMLLWTPSSR